MNRLLRLWIWVVSSQQFMKQLGQVNTGGLDDHEK